MIKKHLQGEIECHSRHLYDIHKIVNCIGITDELERLIGLLDKLK